MDRRSISIITSPPSTGPVEIVPHFYDRLSVPSQSGTKSTYVWSNMTSIFMPWMMTTNFLICLAAWLGFIYPLTKSTPLEKPKLQRSTNLEP